MRWSPLVICLLASMMCSQADAEPYRLADGDKVEVRVFDRPDLSVTVRVDVDGNLRLPLIGAIQASGQTADDIERQLGNAYRLAGILDPRIAVTIAEAGQVFVAGTVHNPGRYAWEPGLTAMKAYALAGGAPRLSDSGNALLVFEAYRAIEQEQQAVVRLAGAILRHARLTAEAAAGTTFTPPAGWASGLGSEQASELVERETTLFDRRRTALEGELANL